MFLTFWGPLCPRVVAPLLYSVYTPNIPTHYSSLLAIIANATYILSFHDKSITTSYNLQDHLLNIETWGGRRRDKVNGAKSAHLTFTLSRPHSSPLTLNSVTNPSPEPIRNLGILISD